MDENGKNRKNVSWGHHLYTELASIAHGGGLQRWLLTIIHNPRKWPLSPKTHSCL